MLAYVLNSMSLNQGNSSQISNKRYCLVLYSVSYIYTVYNGKTKISLTVVRFIIKVGFKYTFSPPKKLQAAKIQMHTAYSHRTLTSFDPASGQGVSLGSVPDAVAGSRLCAGCLLRVPALGCVSRIQEWDGPERVRSSGRGSLAISPLPRSPCTTPSCVCKRGPRDVPAFSSEGSRKLP